MIPYGQFGSAAEPLPRPAWPGLPALVFCATLIGGYGTATGTLLPTVFIGSGIILSALYSSSGRTKARLSLLLMAAEIAGLAAGGMGVATATGIGLAVTVQAWVGSWVLHIIAPQRLELSRLTSIMKLGIVALVVAPASGMAAQTLIGLFEGGTRTDLAGTFAGSWPDFWSSTILRWTLPHALGILLAVPIFRGVMNRARPHAGHVGKGERVLCHLATLVVSLAVYHGESPASLFLIAPLLVWTSIRLGIGDTALTVFISLMVASSATAQGLGPIIASQPDADSRALFLDLLYLGAFASSIPIAATLEAKLKLQRALEDNLEQTRQIVENMSEIVFRTDARGRWTFLNPAWEPFTGYTVEESLGWQTTKLLHPDDLAQTAYLYPPLVSGMVDKLTLRQRFYRKDGEIRHIEVSARAIRDDNGQFAGTSGIIRDTTEFTHYVLGLESSERRFRALCDTAPIGIIRFDPNGTVTYANKRFELISLVSAKSIIGSSWIRLFRDQDRHIAHQISASDFAPGSVIERDIRLLDQSHIRKWVTLVVTGEFDADGLLTGYIAAFADISQRKAAEAELAARTSQMRTLAENINDMVFRFSLDGVCRYATPSVRDVLGLDPDLIIGCENIINLHPEDEAAVRTAVQPLRQGRKDHATFSFRALPQGENSQYLWLEANCRLLRSIQGQPVEIVASVRDVTAHKRLELDLVDAKLKAESAANAKSAFLANLSHEIRTPMNGVIGLAELLATRDLDEESAHYVHLISESGSNMMRLLNDILDMSKIDSHRLQIARDAFDLHECLANSLSLMTASAAEKGLDLRLDITPRTPRHIWGDSLRVRQILANLIGNAIKFTMQGQIILRADHDGDMLSISVSDTGIGIAPEAQSLVFEDFVQADPRISHGFGGTGLGLPISRRLAEAMGGILQLSSMAGQGTIVTLRIPAKAAASPPPSPIAAATSDGNGKTAGRHVLIVEDNPTNQIIISGMLKQLGCRWATLACGNLVLDTVRQAKLAEDPFDLILMDLLLPGMDGCDAARALREAGYSAEELPIIAVTANAFGEDIKHCQAAGMQGHIAKPIRLELLQRALEQLDAAAVS